MNLDSIWDRHRDFEFPAPAPDFCSWAELFNGFATVLVDAVSQDPTIVSVNQAKILLLDKYFDFYASVSRRHQDHIGNRNGHVCIYQVFLETYFQLRQIELQLIPPLLFLPPEPPPPPPPPQIHGIFIGEGDEFDEEAGKAF